MNTTAKVPRDTYKTMTNLLVALDEVRRHLREEGRYASSSSVDLAIRAIDQAKAIHGIQTPGYD